MLVHYGKKLVDTFGDYLNEVDEVIQSPKSHTESQLKFIEKRINGNFTGRIREINDNKLELFMYLTGYQEKSYGNKWHDSKQAVESNEPVGKLHARCMEKYNEWKSYFDERDYDEKYMKAIILDLVDLKRRLYETNDYLVFSPQRLLAVEKKFYRLIDWNPSICDDYFYLDLNRLKSVDQPKSLSFPVGGISNSCVFAVYGGRVISTWCEYGLFRLQLLEFDENSDTMKVIKTVTNSACDDTMIAGSHKDNMIALAFTFDKQSYWIKTYDTELNELGILCLTYSPIFLHVDENYLYVLATQSPLMRVYDSKLNELVSFTKTINSDVYYLLRYGNKILFKNDFVFFINENKHMDVILRSNDQIIHTLDLVGDVLSFQVDSLMRLILYTDNPSKFSIHDLNNNKIQEIDAKPSVSSFCITDNGFLVATNANNGEISLY
jgi:hypothetical protein